MFMYIQHYIFILNKPANQPKNCGHPMLRGCWSVLVVGRQVVITCWLQSDQLWTCWQDLAASRKSGTLWHNQVWRTSKITSSLRLKSSVMTLIVVTEPSIDLDRCSISDMWYYQYTMAAVIRGNGQNRSDYLQKITCRIFDELSKRF